MPESIGNPTMKKRRDQTKNTQLAELVLEISQRVTRTDLLDGRRKRLAVG